MGDDVVIYVVQKCFGNIIMIQDYLVCLNLQIKAKSVTTIHWHDKKFYTCAMDILFVKKN